jgi:flagellar hook-basal body complex protein FliE
MAVVINPTQRLVPGLIEKTGAIPLVPQEQSPADQPKFSDMIGNMLQSVNQVQQASADIQQAFLSGEEVELHQMMIKAEEAGISMDLLLEVRNRLVDGYNEIMKMPL